ncbi:MAG: general secretion pathway protein GspG [Parachlamydiaceae bacterium]|nr:general secretion pathway protein GspG [Parachlamydiaceae bacterium]
MKTYKNFVSLQRRCITLIEIMIVMFLIALITGVVAYNYRGALDEGKAFKTKAGIERLQTILNLAVADNPDIQLSGGGWKTIIENSPLVSNHRALTKDGWGVDYIVNYDSQTGNVAVRSEKLDAYEAAHPHSMFKK